MMPTLPLCCFGTGVHRSIDGGGWFWERCDQHLEIEDATAQYRKRLTEWLAELKKE